MNTRYEKNFSKIQKCAYSLIQSDAKLIITLYLSKNKKLKSNYFCMFLPYLAIFSYGAENWGKKMKLPTPLFNGSEKRFYSKVRQNHKFFDNDYNAMKQALAREYKKADSYFFSNMSLCSTITGVYYNVGVDTFNNKYCGNTVLISSYLPDYNYNYGKKMKTLSEVAGKLSAFYLYDDFSFYKYDVDAESDSLDINFEDNPILNGNSIDILCYFSIICSINFIIEFIDKLFVEEIPQKLKYAYLIYYYLCNLIKDINSIDNISLEIDSSYINSDFRNCIAHYGLGQVMKEEDIIEDDILFGLTNKIFNIGYSEFKNIIYKELYSVRNQIENIIIRK